jgi:5-methyltetrahydropteroyltriglutamate--homocysteine methyltransferase
MRRSTTRILTTHVGSIPRPEQLRELLKARRDGQSVDDALLDARIHEAILDVVKRQAEAGIDVVSDGEMGKTMFLAYADERLTGFTQATPDDPTITGVSQAASWSRRLDSRREWRTFREYYASYLPVAMPPSAPPSVCTGPVAYKGEAVLQRDLESLRTALDAAHVEEAFVPAIVPSMVTRGNKNLHYEREVDYLSAVATALRTEYRAIVEAGFILQIDDPGLGETWDTMIPAPSLVEYRRLQATNIEILNAALEGIPEDRIRYHLCWGSWQGPHTVDLALGEIVDLVLSVKAGAYSIEAANPRHSWEWRIWQDVTLPADKILIPGVIAHTTAVVEHPETIAERITNFANAVGRERVIAGADCGFAQGFLFERQHPTVMWAKFEALAAGARLASARLWR